MWRMKISMGLVGLVLTTCSHSWARDPGWPRQLEKPGGQLIVYQPQVDKWTNFTDIAWRQAFQLTPTGGKQVVGAVSFEATSQVNTDTHMVFFHDLKILNTYFPSKDPATSAQLVGRPSDSLSSDPLFGIGISPAYWASMLGIGTNIGH